MSDDTYPSSRPLMQRATMMMGLTMTGAALPGLAMAQAADEPAEPAGSSVLDPVYLSGGAGGRNTNNAATGTTRLPASVRETPRVINVVPEEIIEAQGVTSLEEALRNVPGITLSTGEGRGGQSGDQFRIRGLTAKGDIYQDGLRDFGVFTRDTFNTEAVQVIKGPSGDAFGVGNLGGVINQQSKRAHLGDANEATLVLGTGPTTRATLDMNKQLSDTRALRFNLMAQNQDVPDRDHATADRRGIAVDFGAGLGTGTEWHLGAAHVSGRGTPDYGQPLAQGSDGIFRPLREFGVPGYDDSTSYIRSTDKDDTDVTTLTSSFSHRLSEGVTITNDTRLTHYSRNFSGTNPGECDFACLTSLRNGVDVPLSYGAGGGMTYDQDGYGFQNLTTGRFDFATGSFRHRAIVGLDITYQKEDRRGGSWTGRDSNQMILNPQFDYPGAFFTWNDHASRATSFNVGLFAGDRMWFNEQWSVQANARLDYFDSSFDDGLPGGENGSADSTEISPALSVIWEPRSNVMAYASASRTYRPIGTDIATSTNFSPGQIPVSGDAYEPERSDLIELGGKIDLLDGKLGLTGALFQIDKDNSYNLDLDGTVAFSDNGQSRRVRGVELGAAGDLTESWSLSAAYAYLDGEITASTNSAEDLNVGNDAPGVSRHNVALWANYAVPGATLPLAGELSLGGGLRYASKYWADAGNTAEIPETLQLDAVIAYETDRYRLALNAYNLTDHDNYASSFNASRAVPAAGRSFAVTFAAKF